ncbi:MAG: NFACT family protein [Thermoplasmata archaeon]|nr:MAG: NFACT family protein [Thermoplasmata archaeon]
MKEGMSSFDVAAMVKELQFLIGARIDKIYQPRRNQLLLRLRVPEKGRRDLIITVGKWLYLASQSVETPKEPSSYAMLLRKHLTNGKIVKIEQHEFDRIVVIFVEKAGQYRLVCEMFKEGNVVLVQEGKIIQPLIPKTWSHRVVRAQREYVFPPSGHNPRTLNLEGLKEIMKSSKKNLVRTLALDINLGGMYAEETCLLAEIDKERKAKELSGEEMKNIFENMQQLFQSLENEVKGIMVATEDKPLEVLPFPLKSFDLHTQKTFDSLSEAMETFLGEEREEVPGDVAFQERQARIQRQLAQQEEAVLNLQKRAGEHKERAELVYAHYPVCQDILNLIKSSIKERDTADVITKLKEFPEFKDFAPDKKEVTISLKDEVGHLTDITLDYTVSVEENAGLYYDKAKKAKDKLEGAKKSIEDTKKRMKALESGKHEEEKRVRKQTKRFWFEKYRWFISSGGNIVIAGRDAKSNDRIVKKYLTEKDRYAHADIHGAPSVVIKNKDGEVSEETLREACEFALAHSKAWNAKIGGGSAYWVMPDQVSKTPPAGEFLPRGAFMIYGKKHMVTNMELKLAAGPMQYEGSEKMMCGPVSAIKTHCSRFVVFEPGETKRSDFVRKLRKEFEFEEEDISKILPPGNVKIVTSTGLSEDGF